MAATSLTDVGLSCLMYLRIPELSSWKMPVVSPLERWSKVFLSSRGMSLRDILAPPLLAMMSRALPRMVRLMRPRKSIFRRPSLAMGSIENWVTAISSPSLRDARWRGRSW